MLMTFDSPDGVLCCVRRVKSNTPLQALTLLNDTVFVECAQALGRRIMAETAGTQERLEYGFCLCVARPPSAAERATLLQLYTELRSLNANSQAGEEGAWGAVARVLLNLDEMVTRE
jgi:hypothetical protein